MLQATRISVDKRGLSPIDKRGLPRLIRPTDYDLSPAQETEIQRRLKMVKEGAASGRLAAEVFADIRARYS